MPLLFIHPKANMGLPGNDIFAGNNPLRTCNLVIFRPPDRMKFHCITLPDSPKSVEGSFQSEIRRMENLEG
jgi:hypothetical protein